MRCSTSRAGLFKSFGFVLTIGLHVPRLSVGQDCLTFSDPQPLNSNAFFDSGQDRDVDLATDRRGNWVAVWGTNSSLSGAIGNDADILLARSSDSGFTWTDPQPLNTNAVSDVNSDYDADPHIATDGQGNWVAVWYSTNSLEGTIGTDGDILFARSLDAGATWTDPQPLNNNAWSDGNTMDASPQVATDGLGNWIAVWQVSDPGTDYDYDIMFARSFDAGANWSDAELLTPEAASDARFDQGPRVTTDRHGTWMAVWESSACEGGCVGYSTPEESEVLVSRSFDVGATWTSPELLNNDAGYDGANDHLPQLTTDGQGNWVAGWYRYSGGDLAALVARSSDAGATWTDPRPLDNKTGFNGSPQVTTDGLGNWFAVWGSRSLAGTLGTDWDILFARSLDAGATWTNPQPLNNNASHDSGSDHDPQLATDGQGNWIAAWSSGNSLNGTIGTDIDILFSRSQLDSACCSDNDCDNGLYCDGEEQCTDGRCTEGQDPCNEDESCDEPQNRCVTLVPDLPHGVSASDGTFAEKVQVTWDSDSLAREYRVFRCGNSSDSSCQPLGGWTPNTSYDDTTAAPETTYWYRVKARNNNGESGLSTADQGHRASDGPTPQQCDSGACDDGLFCNGDEICLDHNCFDGPMPCERDEICDEDLDECRPANDCSLCGLGCGIGPQAPFTGLIFSGLLFAKGFSAGKRRGRRKSDDSAG